MAILQPIFDIIKSCSDTCAKIKEWFEPFFWVLVGSSPPALIEAALLICTRTLYNGCLKSPWDG